MSLFEFSRPSLIVYDDFKYVSFRNDGNEVDAVISDQNDPFYDENKSIIGPNSETIKHQQNKDETVIKILISCEEYIKSSSSLFESRNILDEIAKIFDQSRSSTLGLEYIQSKLFELLGEI
jgi:hypothetical protein